MRSNEGPVFGNKFQLIPSEPPLRAVEPARQDPGPKPFKAGEEIDKPLGWVPAWPLGTEADACDELLIARLKKRKLQIKDEIARIARLLPGPGARTDPGHLGQDRVLAWCILRLD